MNSHHYYVTVTYAGLVEAPDADAAEARARELASYLGVVTVKTLPDDSEEPAGPILETRHERVVGPDPRD